MENNENKPLEATEEVGSESSKLTREEILESSRIENKNGDERERAFFAKACSLGFSVGLMLAGIIIIVTVLTSGRLPMEVLMMMSGMQATQSFIVAVGNKKLRKLYLILGIVECVVFVIFCVLWALQLCGVAL